MDSNPLRIIEDDLVGDSECDKVDFIENREQFGFDSKGKHNSLLIVEEKDLKMDDNNNNIHRLSLQVESGDSDSLVMKNEAINRTIIRIGSTESDDFGEVNKININNASVEAINHEIENQLNESSLSDVDDSENDGGKEVVVNILGQINEIVGYFFCMFVKPIFRLWCRPSV